MCWISDLNVGVEVEDFGHCMAVLVDVFASHGSFGIYEPGFCINLFSFYQTMKSDVTLSCVIINFGLGMW